jgi:hypothetical protein
MQYLLPAKVGTSFSGRNGRSVNIVCLWTNSYGVCFLRNGLNIAVIFEILRIGFSFLQHAILPSTYAAPYTNIPFSKAVLHVVS